MAKKSAPKPVERVTVINVKGTEKERKALHDLSERTGVPVAEMVRRGIAMWAKSRSETAPKDWEGK